MGEPKRKKTTIKCMFAMSLPSDNCDTLISSKFAVELRNVFVSCEEWPVADKLFGSIIVANLH